MDRPDVFAYRPELHSVRRVTAYDFRLGGYRLRRGSYVAYNGAWDRKGIVVSVRLKKSNVCSLTCYRRGQGHILPVSHVLEVQVAYAGAYFSTAPSRRMTSRWNQKLQRHIYDENQRFFGKTYVPAKKLSYTTFDLYVLKDGTIHNLNQRTGWNVVVPRGA